MPSRMERAAPFARKLLALRMRSSSPCLGDGKEECAENGHLILQDKLSRGVEGAQTRFLVQTTY